MDLIASRSSLSSMIETEISQSVNKYYVDIVTVSLKDITFNEALNQRLNKDDR